AGPQSGAAAAAPAASGAAGASAVATQPGDPSVRGAAPNVRGPDGSTPLMWAVYRGELSEVKRLLKAGARPDVGNRYGATPMQMAATVGNAAILKLLLDAGANVDSPNAEGQTALMLVARTGNVDAAKLLLRHGATVNAREEWGGQTALMWASARRHPQMMELLISHGADVNAQSVWRDWERHVTAESRAKRTNTGGLTPLMYAAREDCLECVDVLLKHHVDIDKPDPDGVAPVTFAIMNDNWDIAARLINAGCDVNQWDIYGRGPLFAAIESGVDSPGSRSAGPLDPPNKVTGRQVDRSSPCCSTAAPTPTCRCSFVPRPAAHSAVLESGESPAARRLCLRQQQRMMPRWSSCCWPMAPIRSCIRPTTRRRSWRRSAAVA